jgi:hypothetical protein
MQTFMHEQYGSFIFKLYFFFYCILKTYSGARKTHKDTDNFLVTVGALTG